MVELDCRSYCITMFSVYVVGHFELFDTIVQCHSLDVLVECTQVHELNLQLKV